MDTAPPDVIAEWLEQERRAIVRNIRRHGVHLTYVSDDAGCACCRALGEITRPPDEPPGPPFGYTTGLFGAGHPELLVTGLGQARSLLLLNTLAQRVLDEDGDLTPGEEVLVDDQIVMVEEVDDPGKVLLIANAYYQRPRGQSVPAFRLTCAQTLGRGSRVGEDVRAWAGRRSTLAP